MNKVGVGEERRIAKRMEDRLKFRLEVIPQEKIWGGVGWSWGLGKILFSQYNFYVLAFR